MKKIFNDKKLFVLFALIVITFVTTVFSIFKPFNSPTNKNNYIDSAMVIGKIYDDITLTQKVQSKLDTLEAISIKYATFGYNNIKGDLKVEIFDSKNKLIYLNEYKLNKLKDNEELEFNFKQIKNTYEKDYYIKLTFTNVEIDNPFTLYAGSGYKDLNIEKGINSKTNIEDAIYINQIGEGQSYYFTFVLLFILLIEVFILSYFIGRKIKFDLDKKKFIITSIILMILSIILAFATIYLKVDVLYGHMPKKLFLLVTFLSLIVAATIGYASSCKNIKLEQLFVFVAIVLGALFIVLIPQGKTPDEPFHFKMAYQLATGNFLLKNGEGPADIFRVVGSYQELIQIFNGTLSVDSTMVSLHDGGYSLLLYVVSAIGIFFGSILGLNIMKVYYLGVICNYIFFVILGYYMIKKIPFGKFMLFVYLLSPMYLQQAMSLSADVLINATCILFIVYILYIKFTKKSIETKDFVLLAILAMYTFLSKFAYFPLIGLLFLIKNYIFKYIKEHKKITILMLGLISIICISSLLWLKFYNVDNATKFVDNTNIGGMLENQDNQSKMSYILSSPGKFIYMIINTLYTKMDFYIYSFSGSSLGWFEFAMPNYLSIIYFVILFLSFYIDNSKNVFKSSEKKLIFFIWFINFWLILAGLYLGWGEIRDLFVEGVQGRYFIPINILIFILLSSDKMKLNIKENKLFVVLPILFINIYTVLMLLNYL